MSTKFLGEEIDIHTGGEDNIFPHHECEIAQSECAYGKPFVRIWMHKRRVNFANEKMSKSLGNILSLSDIDGAGFSPLDLKYFFLSSHYRSHTQFTWKGLEDAKKARLKIIEWCEELQKASPSQKLSGLGESVDAFEAAMNDDLNTPAAIAVIFDLMARSRRESALGEPVLKTFCENLEHIFGCFESPHSIIPDDVLTFAEEREKARKERDFARADQLRKQIEGRGFVLEDLPDGPRVLPASQR